MALSETDMQCLRISVGRSDRKGDSTISVRTDAVVELGGIEMLPEADKLRYDKTPEAGKKLLTSQVKVEGMKKLLERAG